VNPVYPPETEPFRRDVREWAVAEVARVRAEAAGEDDFRARWQALLYASGWACPTWPEEYGGRGLSTLQASIALDEMMAAGAPIPRATGGELLVGPTILQWGNDEQRARFLPSIARGEATWCQGFSEPDAGSDLASLTTTASLDGDEWVLHGHKKWTSEADEADLMFVLAVTDPDNPRRHRAITYFLLPMDQPGVEVRPIVQPDGRVGFAEVVLSGARCPTGNVLGEVGEGWRVAMETLGIERGVNPVSSHHRLGRELADLVGAARANGRIDDAVVRARIVDVWCGVQLVRLNGYRLLTADVHRRTDAGTIALAATNKAMFTELHQSLTNLSIDVLGAEGQILTGSMDTMAPPGVGMGSRRPEHDYPVSPAQASFLFSRAGTIYGGTSQIQRNIVGERVLGLPREPR
jgi:alkylation response protein AidB-like acyl-CoA dehydrogenase